MQARQAAKILLFCSTIIINDQSIRKHLFVAQTSDDKNKNKAKNKNAYNNDGDDDDDNDDNE